MTIDTRFEVGDSCCGAVGHYASRDAAFRAARAHEVTHSDENIPEQVEVFDRMTHRGAKQLWTADGSVVAVRPWSMNSRR